MCTYFNIGDHLVQALVLRCVLITTLVTIWYKPLVLRCVLVKQEGLYQMG